MTWALLVVGWLGTAGLVTAVVGVGAVAYWRVLHKTRPATASEERLLQEAFEDGGRTRPELRVYSGVVGASSAWAPGKSWVIVSEDLLSGNVEQAQAVVRHELGHIRSFGSVQDGAGAVALTACFFAADHLSSQFHWSLPPLLQMPFWVGVAFAILLTSRALARQTELACDAYAVVHGTDPDTMADALLEHAPEGTGLSYEPKFAEGLLLTHPRMRHRVDILRRWGSERGATLEL